MGSTVLADDGPGPFSYRSGLLYPVGMLYPVWLLYPPRLLYPLGLLLYACGLYPELLYPLGTPPIFQVGTAGRALPANWLAAMLPPPPIP